MKKLLMLSDIHANWPALEAILHNEGSWDGVAFCGDVVGVGPQPVECVRWVAEHAEFAVRGDLDKALAFGRDCRRTGSFRMASPITRTWQCQISSAETFSKGAAFAAAATAAQLLEGQHREVGNA
jgi:predicted phosphodiesterase